MRYFANSLYSLLLGILSSVLLLHGYGQEEREATESSASFSFQQGDRIALVGNGLADRMQHSGWVETLLQHETRGLNLSFRNMAVSGDRPNSYPRSRGFMGMANYLKQVEADVIFCFFGYNESYGQEKKLEEFKMSLREMITSFRKTQPNGQSEPRIILFSPIAHEDLQNKNLPSGTEQNKNLSLYTKGMGDVAKQMGVGFIDLFHPTKALYESTSTPLTINGVHLNDKGYLQLAGVITQALLKIEIKATLERAPSLSHIRENVLDKNWHWHARYRATDGNDIWGGRGKLAFIDGQTNEDVLTHELIMLDQMTQNRDEAIWATVKGEKVELSDANVPRPLEVKTNLYKKEEKAPLSSYKSPSESLQTFTVPEDFKLEVFADETRFPELANPVQLQVDGKGRLWAAAWKTYPKWEPLKEMNDAILIFHDDNKDGKADRCIEFARVHNPVGFEFWNGGVIVSSQPNLIFLKDTDGDDIADVREILLQGIGSADTHHAANNLHYGPDGALYWQSGVFLVNNIEHPWGPSLKTGASGIYRFDPRQYTVTFHAGNYSPNPHGTCFDYWGYHYAQGGTGGKAVQIRRDQNGFKTHPLFNREVRPVTSCAIVSSENFPAEMQQNYLLANVIGFLGLKSYNLHREGVSEKGYTFGQVWGVKAPDPLFSTDSNFRPTDMKFGEDGSLFISDWQNVIIGHMQHNIRDPKRDKKHGRIYRLHYEKKTLQKAVQISGASIGQLLNNLMHPIDGVRHRTRVELSARPTEMVIKEVENWVKTFQPSKKEDAHHLLEALWVFQQHNVRNEELLQTLLTSPEPHAVEAAKTVQHLWTVADPRRTPQKKEITKEEQKVKIKAPAHLSTEAQQSYLLGAEIYNRSAHCATCHQPDGKGIGEIYPPINMSEWVTGDKERLIKLTLHGLWGKITVNGKTYDPEKGVPPMTAFHNLLSNEEIAAVLTYVRNTWKNTADPITPKEVERVRIENKDRDKYWDAEELLDK